MVVTDNPLNKLKQQKKQHTWMKMGIFNVAYALQMFLCSCPLCSCNETVIMQI